MMYMRKRVIIYSACFLLSALCCLFIVDLCFKYLHEHAAPTYVSYNIRNESVLGDIDVSTGLSISYLPSVYDKQYQNEKCTMETCFDWSLCTNGFKVFIHEIPVQTQSDLYSRILYIIRSSTYVTTDPNEACIYILPCDTLDRDRLSDDYVAGLEGLVRSFPLWRNGQNHVIFNLYSGTWPDYSDSLDVDLGKAIIAKSSFSKDVFRPGFDISLPLFSREHPLKSGNTGTVTMHSHPGDRFYIISFKGKRYVYGVGSRTRNSLYLIDNGADVLILTTCKHGKERDWKSMQDERCEMDNAAYGKYDYTALLTNSTFCLVPRGRRLGSFRFLEALQAGCIPIVLSDGWELPFSEVIDWNRAALVAKEGHLMQVPSLARSISLTTIMDMKQQTQLLWNNYFSSVDKIISSIFGILEQRVSRLHKPWEVWHSSPGSRNALLTYSKRMEDFPFYQNTNISSGFALIYPVERYSTKLFRFLKGVINTKYLKEVIIVSSHAGDNDVFISENITLIPFKVVYRRKKESKFNIYSIVSTECILVATADLIIKSGELDFGYLIWRQFPDRIVGFEARLHYWHSGLNQYQYSSKISNDYSMVLPGFVHKYYLYLYSTKFLPTMNIPLSCEDCLLNFVVGDVTGRAPVLLASVITKASTVVESKFNEKQLCMDVFANQFGYMPLIYSQLRIDPVLYHDKISILRKRYKRL